MALWKDQDTVATIDRLTSVSETAAKTSLARQRKKVQQGYAQSPFPTIVCSRKKTPGSRRCAQDLQCLASCCCRDLMAQAARPRGAKATNIYIGEVVADH